MDQEKRAAKGEEAQVVQVEDDEEFDYGSDTKSDAEFRTKKEPRPSPFQKDQTVQMKITEGTEKTGLVQNWKKFVIRRLRQQKGSGRWSYQLNNEDGTPYSGQEYFSESLLRFDIPNRLIVAHMMKWFSTNTEVDPEKAMPPSPTRSTDTNKTLGPESRASTAVEAASPVTKKAEVVKDENAEQENTGSEEGSDDDGIDEEEEGPSAEESARNEVRETLTIPLEEYPKGYPRLAAFKASESSFSIYRAFDYLHSRVILEMQDELRCLEENLGELDLEDSNAPCPQQRLRVRSREADLCQARQRNVKSKRADLLSQIRDKLVRYDELVMKARELNAFQRPSRRDYRSLRHWFCYEDPLTYTFEAEYIKRKEDLITLRQGREWAGFDGLIESSIKKLPTWISRKLFTTPELRKKTSEKSINYFSPSRVEKLVGLIITLIIFVLLVLPVFVMYHLTSIGTRDSTIDAVGLLVVFTLLFSAAMSLLTKAKRHELFAASAAYCAVLVVFISNFSNENGGGGKGA